MPENDDFFNDLESEAKDAPKPKASLDAVHAMGKAAVELQRRIEAGEALLKTLKTERYKLLNEQMPSMMDDMKVPSIVISDYKLDCTTYYKANIAADDPEEKRSAAFAWVEAAGGGDIINNVVTVAFPKEMADEAILFSEEIKKRFDNRKDEIKIQLDKKVPWNRLTSWLKDFVETPPKRGETKLPVPLELLNATIGRLVKIKEV